MSAHAGVAQRNGRDPFDALLVVDEAVLDDSAVPVGRVRAQADIASDQKIRVRLAQQRKRADHGVGVRVGVRSFVVLRQGVDDAEKQNRSQPHLH